MSEENDGMRHAEEVDAVSALAEQNRLLREQNALLQEELRITKSKLQKLIGPDLTLLPDDQREVLETIRALSADACAKAEELIAQLEGQQMTEALTHNLNQTVLAHGWKFVCDICGKSSAISWRAGGGRYAAGGRARFSHFPGSHGSLARVRKLSIVIAGTPEG